MRFQVGSAAPLVSAVICAIVVGCGAGADPSDVASDNLESAPAPSASSPNGPVATGLAADLAAAGLDVNALPPTLDALDDNTLHKVMKTFTKSLNVRCDGCHDTTDYAKATSEKKITMRMWSDFVGGLKLKDGSGPLYCDSCHQGKKSFLPSSLHGSLRTWMQSNFVDKLARKDGADHTCSTCHGTPFTGEIFKDLWHAEP